MSFQYKIRGEQFVQFERQSQDYIEQRDQDLESSLNFDFSNLNASNLTSGTVPSARVTGSYTGITGVGTLTVGSIPASLLTGSTLPAGITASSLTSVGTLGTLVMGGSITGYGGFYKFGTFPSDLSIYLGTDTASGNVNIQYNSTTKLSVGATGITVTGTATATTFSGSGASLTSIPAGQLTGTVASGQISGSYTGITGVGTLAAGSIPATLLTGTVASARISGSYTGITGVGTLTVGSIPASLLTGTTLPSGITASSLNSVGTLTSGLSVSGGVINSVFSINITGSGNEFVARNPTTGSGNAAHWVFVSPDYRLYRNTSTIRDKENIQSVGDLLNPNMIDAIDVQLWNRKTAPGIPEVGPMAEEMDAISPFLSTRGLEWDENGAPIPSPIDGINSNSWLSLLTIGMQDLRQRLQQLETT
jgi:hypothetical protein